MSAASMVQPPTEGNILVLALTTSASSAQDLGAEGSAEQGYWTFISDVDCYITFGAADSVADPDETATSGDGRTWYMPAGLPQHFELDRRSRYFKAKGTASGHLRYYSS